MSNIITVSKIDQSQSSINDIPRVLNRWLD